MIRFFVTPQELTGRSHTLTGENAKHAKVLRLKTGEEVLLCDGQGMECLCTLEDPDRLTLALGERRKCQSEAAVKVSVYMAFPKADLGAVLLFKAFAHANRASKTGFSCSSRFSCRSSGVSSANACSSLKSREQ